MANLERVARLVNLRTARGRRVISGEKVFRVSEIFNARAHAFFDR